LRGYFILKKLSILILVLFLIICTKELTFGQEIVVYSARKEHLIRPLFDAYSEQTGIKIKYITGKAPVLMQRIQVEGENTPADLLLTVDAGNLWHAAQVGILQTVYSPVLEKNIPSHLRDPENKWFGLSVRARTIVYSTDRVKPEELSTYEDLANPKWKGRLLLRTSKKVYNQSLVAMLISEHGEVRAEQIVKGWVNNLAAPPFASDTKVMQAIIAGQGDLGIVNTYYYGRLLKKNSPTPLALFWPNQNSNGVHVNVSGAGVTLYAKHQAAALALLEWLSSEKAQNLFVDSNLEYPANLRVLPHPLVAKWGEFKHNPINLKNAGIFQADAIRLMDRVGYK
jgi:iron(III) transport system substrate-binding protein